ncbi:MAG: prolipoprotein diacylglyceryl transferase [Cyclonatronaceae bacterium]
MNSDYSDYFFWEGQPVMFNLGEVNLPFAVSIPGLILAAVLFVAAPYFLLRRKDEQTSSGKKRRRKRQKGARTDDKPEELTTLQTLGLLVGSLVVGQLVFLVLPGPTIEQFGPVLIRWYGVLFAAAFLIGYFIGRKLFIDAGKDVALADTLLMYIIVGTVVGARLGHVLFYDFDYYIRNLHEVLFIWQGGLASHGAAIGIILAMWLYLHRHRGIGFFWLGDRLTIPVILGGAFIRVGNFFNSEIVGLPSEVPWAVVFARVDLEPRHPTMLYEALICILLFVILIALYRYYKKHPPEGLLTGVFMILLFSSRFFVEYTKVEQAAFTETWLIGMGQLLSIPFIIFGIWVLWTRVKTRPKKNPPRAEKSGAE